MSDTQYSRSRSWMVTQRTSDMPLDDLMEKLSAYTWIGQEENGEGGFRHYQIFIHHKNPIKFTTLKKLLPTAHLETRKGSINQAYEYVTKDETRVNGPFGNGTIDVTASQGSRSDLERLREQILSGVPLGELIVSEPATARFTHHLERLEMEMLTQKHSTTFRSDISAEYWWGKSGSGKTRAVHELHDITDIYRVTNYQHPFDMYSGQSVLVIDEYHSQFRLDFLLNLLDIYPLQLPARYNNKWAGFTKVYIISNEPLERQYVEEQLTKQETFNALKRRITEIKEFK